MEAALGPGAHGFADLVTAPLGIVPDEPGDVREADPKVDGPVDVAALGRLLKIRGGSLA